MHVGAGGTVGQPERACGCQRRLALRARRRWRGRCAPGRPWQPGHCLALRARRRRRGRYAPGRVHLLSPRCMRTLPLGGGDVEDVVRFALLETLGARRASRSCRGRGWVGTPRGPHCRRCRHARAERRHSGSQHEGGARAASPPRQGLAPPARPGRSSRVPRDSNERAGGPWSGPPREATRRQLFSRASPLIGLGQYFHPKTSPIGGLAETRLRCGLLSAAPRGFTSQPLGRSDPPEWRQRTAGR